MAAPIDLTGKFTPSLTHAEQQHAQQMHNQQLQALRSVKAEDRQEYEEDHRSFTTFSQDLADKWEQRFEALATLARAAGVSSGDIEAIRKQERQPAPEPTPAEGTAGQAAAEEQEHAQAAAASKPAAGKKLSKHIQKTVDKGEAAIDPAGDELTAAGLIIGEYVWGEYADDGVWYPGEVLAEPLTSLPCVRFDDGEQDDELEGRAWRRRKPPPPQQQQPTQPTQPRHGKQAEQDAVPAKRRRKSATAAAPEAAATAGAAAGSGTGAAAGAVAGVTGAASVAATAVAAATVAPAVAAIQQRLPIWQRKQTRHAQLSEHRASQCASMARAATVNNRLIGRSTTIPRITQSSSVGLRRSRSPLLRRSSACRRMCNRRPLKTSGGGGIGEGKIRTPQQEMRTWASQAMYQGPFAS